MDLLCRTALRCHLTAALAVGVRSDCRGVGASWRNTAVTGAGGLWRAALGRELSGTERLCARLPDAVEGIGRRPSGDVADS